MFYQHCPKIADFNWYCLFHCLRTAFCPRFQGFFFKSVPGYNVDIPTQLCLYLRLMFYGWFQTKNICLYSNFHSIRKTTVIVTFIIFLSYYYYVGCTATMDVYQRQAVIHCMPKLLNELDIGDINLRLRELSVFTSDDLEKIQRKLTGVESRLEFLNIIQRRDKGWEALLQALEINGQGYLGMQQSCFILCFLKNSPWRIMIFSSISWRIFSNFRRCNFWHNIVLRLSIVFDMLSPQGPDSQF